LRLANITLFSSAPAFLQLKSFWDIWDLYDSLSSRVALSFQWVPGHAGLPGKEIYGVSALTWGRGFEDIFRTRGG